MLQKQFSVQVFDADGSTFVANLPLRDQKSLPRFNARINGGLGELVIDVNQPFDDYDTDAIAFMNIIDVYAVDRDNPRGRRIYRGFISRFTPYLRGSDQGVEVTCLGLGSLLTFAHYPTTTHTGVDPESIARLIVDDFAALYPGLITYSAASTDPVGTNVTYTYTDLKHSDALKKTLELAVAGWWYSIDPDGLFNFRAKPSSATHTFTIGRDVEELQATRDAERVVNYVDVRRSGGTTTHYQDAASIASFGRRSRIITDSSITNAATADQRGNKELNDNKDEKLKAALTINANFDLESLRVGDTCTVQNYKKGSTVLEENLQIVSLAYEADRVRLELEQADGDLGLALEEFVNS